jgi:hypothetical protein
MPIGRATRSVLALGAVAFAAGSCIPNRLGPESQEWQPEAASAAASKASARDERAACAHRDPLRQAFFGDLHVHTGRSFDAWIRDLRTTPDDAYRFATGEAIQISPLDAEGRGTRSIRLERPLDFAAVTDHAEWLAETTLCSTPGSHAYDSKNCQTFRGERGGLLSLFFDHDTARVMGIVSLGGRPPEICGDDLSQCRSALGGAWKEAQDAAERWYDRSDECSFTTFPAYEYSYSPYRSKVHRNVIFRNRVVPELPISWIDEPTPPGLWAQLRDLCLNAGNGCDVLAIPHNPNMANGRMFTLDYGDAPIDEQRRQARLRASLEPLVEVMQAKGESECDGPFSNVTGEDEFCSFEKLRGPIAQYGECKDGEIGGGSMNGEGCISRLDYARYALIEGLREEKRLGVNPLQFGLVGSTDTHNGSPGDTEEYSFDGLNVGEDETPALRLSQEPAFGKRGNVERNPGGLVGVWAEENARDSIFDALRRRETFATSGTRLTPRFFGGWNLPLGICNGENLTARSYAAGVPMGGVLPPRDDVTAGPAPRGPVFVASALRDPGTPEHPGSELQRIQIIKGWADDGGVFHQQVFNVAGGPNDAAVDLNTCTPVGEGFDSLCGTWRDPDFDPARPSVYYARILENPSCRYSTHECLRLPESERPAACSDPALPKTIQERAWTSAIWYSPAA